MARKAKSWTEKFEDQSAKGCQIKPVPKDMVGMKAGQMMLLATPEIVADALRDMAPGSTMDVKTFRAHLADRLGAEVTCPITTGISLRIAAEAAHEAHGAGEALAHLTPFWRVMDDTTPATKKLTFDPAPYFNQRALEAEGAL